MTYFRLAALAFSTSLIACANQDGVYEPSCVAYEGDVLALKGGRFEWQRFTDERKFNSAGGVEKPFPEYPKTGTYRASQGRLELTTDDQERLQDWFIVDVSGQRYLLDAAQHNLFLEDGDVPDCALRLTEAEAR